MPDYKDDTNLNRPFGKSIHDSGQRMLLERDELHVKTNEEIRQESRQYAREILRKNDNVGSRPNSSLVW